MPLGGYKGPGPLLSNGFAAFVTSSAIFSVIFDVYLHVTELHMTWIISAQIYAAGASTQTRCFIEI